MQQPFWQVISNTGVRCRGVSGVLEANFIKPTHNKQDFEKSTLYFKLETRLKEMSMEYWKYHCHLVGFPNNHTSNSLNKVILEKRKIEDHHIESHVPFQKKAFDNRLSVVSESNIRIQEGNVLGQSPKTKMALQTYRNLHS
ncbi:hypothetical protein ZOSMA_240G00290, partial [Zostera marina]